MAYENDNRVVLTLDAGGTNFVFVAMRGGRQIGESVKLPSEARDLDKSVANIKAGFKKLIDSIGVNPAAISFAFPGPADYPKGIIYNVGNLPAFAGGVALADILKDEFGVPVFINNDGDLFVYGEAIAGFL
ncbi:MAG: ROK family protein, partial [Opitutales bacterium]|nr:ROK family protein [Opitutales bacterium]